LYFLDTISTNEREREREREGVLEKQELLLLVDVPKEPNFTIQGKGK
jgi:hypothetical protein